jgi:glycosyltransferase involved in cell wall biosynthesis
VRAAAASLGFKKPVHYSFVPQSAWVAGRLGEGLVVYHAADEYAAFDGADAAGVRALEQALLERTDLYVACSAPLLGKQGARESILVRHGVEHAHFARALDPATPIPDALRDLPRPIVGFFGLIAEWVDLDSLGETADRLAQTGGGTVVLVGDVRGASPPALARLRARSNVLFAGRRPYEELPGWCRGFDVAVLPFVLNELTIAANPLKLREYLAAGLPVVSTAIPEAASLAQSANRRARGSVILAGSGSELAEVAVERARSADAGPRRERSDAVRDESWDAKASELRAALESALARRVDRISRRYAR